MHDEITIEEREERINQVSQLSIDNQFDNIQNASTSYAQNIEQESKKNVYIY